MSRIPTITIIDDDEEVRVATENLVRSYGYETRTFDSAEAFLGSGEVNRTECLITDIQMPGMSGVDLQGALLKQGCRIPIIFITAFPEDRIRRQVEAAGAIEFLSKPFDADRLINCVTTALNSSAGWQAC